MYGKVLFMAVLSTFLNYALSGDPIFRRDYKYIGEYDAFYKAHQIRRNWTAALATCEEEGSELFTPSSEEEAKAAGKLLNYHDSQYFIGIHDLFAEGEFVTLNGTSSYRIYSKWSPGEPNDANGDEDCVVADKILGTYNDISCSRTELFICKKPNTQIFFDMICQTPDKRYFHSTITNRCYKFHQFPMTWHDAFRKCRNEEADLAIINSKAEAELFVEEFDKYPPGIWNVNFAEGLIHLGFTDLLKSRRFRTTDGKSLRESGYDNWEPKQPDNQHGNEHCGSMFREGTLNDVDCSTRAMFICEKELFKSDDEHIIIETILG